MQWAVFIPEGGTFYTTRPSVCDDFKAKSVTEQALCLDWTGSHQRSGYTAQSKHGKPCTYCNILVNSQPYGVKPITHLCDLNYTVGKHQTTFLKMDFAIQKIQTTHSDPNPFLLFIIKCNSSQPMVDNLDTLLFTHGI